MYSLTTSFPRSECGRCADSAWIECGACGRWYCGPCTRERSGGLTACAHCHPEPQRSTDGGDP